ncbi:hypothetical protein AAX17_05205 [Haemophilus haemolyticus]|uniref:hypothetical protein n=1 Tax=Haemophilus haemolyticus TaxID=726 RepID=UPI00062D7E0D|nr:hypothetical protein [Haemophilus haemolyticus]KKZ55334.1 hypothetical protein AAX17_05205 [Haemophilus haemolyticus]
MVQIFITFCVCFFISSIFHLIELLLDVNFTRLFFQQNLISLLTTLLAINIAVLGIVLSRIVALNQSGENFANTKKEILKSLKEQVALIGLSLALSIFSSKGKYDFYPCLVNYLISVLLMSVFFYAIYILYDTAKSLIDIH